MKRLSLCLMLASCTTFPELDAVQTPGIATAPYPRLVPLETLLDAPAPRAVPDLQADVVARAEALRARAARLQTPVVPAQTRARMRRGVTQPF